MADNREAYESVKERRTLLVVDDELINREILKAILEKDYDIILCEDGEEALRKLQEHQNIISLVILDLIMPLVPGQEVLRQIRGRKEYENIPVIVASGDQSQEIECLDAGASDFIQKPYPDAGVILARVNRAIELFESRKIIESTERDPLTGLYNREFFYSYAVQYDQHHPDTPMDAIVLDINHFGTINERYGRAYADDVLRRVGEKAREMVHDDGGIVCRKDADIFLVYCPHRDDYKAILDNASMGLAGEQNANNRVRLRMGVYSNVDRSLDMERRFDRAKIAADTVRESVTRNIGLYDDSLHKSELYSEQLIEDFPMAIAQKQFRVYFQPKFDIQANPPMLRGAEALVRWAHPEQGTISPGVFIPLFENNGLIQELDHYVWREAAAQIHAWKEELGFTVPVSVNMSRIDLYDANIVYLLLNILEENQIAAEDLHLEITESAYAEDAEQIIESAKRLRSLGFRLEMDDFGTGYSSLNMLSTLPIDILKLDMKFIQTAFAQEKDTRMLEVILEIAGYLAAPVVAEGVETEEQLRALKEIGCDMVQGYYFSPPVPPEKFSTFLREAKEAQTAAGGSTAVPEGKKSEIRKKSSKGFSSTLKRWSDHFSIPLRTACVFFVFIAFLVASALYLADSQVTHGYLEMERASERYILAEQSATDMEIGSDYLTDKVRSFVVSGDFQYLEDYFEEVNVTCRRDIAVSNLMTLMDGETSEAYQHLSMALANSNELMYEEYRAMNLILATGTYEAAQIPQALKDNPLSEADQALSVEEKKALALDLVYGEVYQAYKEKIWNYSELCTNELISASAQERVTWDQRMGSLLTLQTVLTVVLLVVVLVIVLFIIAWVRNPLSQMVESMKAKETVPASGAEELRFVSETYNAIFEENRRTHERLTYGNMHDALTGLYNRSAYDFMRHDLDMARNALLLIDVDKFKTINDTFGHDVGDLVLKEVAEILKYSFRDTDLVFRLGGDEFVVIMTNVTSTAKNRVRDIINQANVMLQQPKEDLPSTSLSVGVAFGDRENPDGDIFKDADTALYRVKEAGRCGCEIF